MNADVGIGLNTNARNMIRMIKLLHKAIENTVYKWSINADMGKQGKMWGIDRHHSLQIAGTPGDRDKVMAAIEWIGACAVEQNHKIVKEIYDIACLSYIKGHCVLPLRRSVLFSSSRMHSEKSDKLSRMLAASANYIQLCHSLNKYKMCGLNNLPEISLNQ